MGFSFGSLEHFIMLREGDHIPRGARILDLGSQNIAGELPEPDVMRFAAAFCDSPAPLDRTLTQPGKKAEDLFAAVGADYTAFDMYSDRRTRIFDLNFDQLPGDLVGSFDVVANYGTSEHVANQFNVFKVAHDALKVGGVMINSVPFFGMPDHGLFNYNPKFFSSLMANNRYEPVYWSFSDLYNCGEDHFRRLSFATNGSSWEGKYVGAALMVIIFKKTSDQSFAPPTDYFESEGSYVPVLNVNETLAGPLYWAEKRTWRFVLKYLRILRRSLMS